MAKVVQQVVLARIAEVAAKAKAVQQVVLARIAEAKVVQQIVLARNAEVTAMAKVVQQVVLARIADGKGCGAECTGTKCGPAECCSGRTAAVCANGAAPTFGAFCADSVRDDQCIACNGGYTLVDGSVSRHRQRRGLLWGPGKEEDPPVMVVTVPMEDVDLASLSSADVASLKESILEAAATAAGFNAGDVDVDTIVLVQDGATFRLRLAKRAANEPIVATLTFTESSGIDLEALEDLVATFNTKVAAGSVSVQFNDKSADITEGAKAVKEVGADGGCSDSRASNFDPLVIDADDSSNEIVGSFVQLACPELCAGIPDPLLCVNPALQSLAVDCPSLCGLCLPPTTDDCDPDPNPLCGVSFTVDFCDHPALAATVQDACPIMCNGCDDVGVDEDELCENGNADPALCTNAIVGFLFKESCPILCGN
eukprot:gene14055-23137_t